MRDMSGAKLEKRARRERMNGLLFAEQDPAERCRSQENAEVKNIWRITKCRLKTC